MSSRHSPPPHTSSRRRSRSPSPRRPSESSSRRDRDRDYDRRSDRDKPRDRGDDDRYRERDSHRDREKRGSGGGGGGGGSRRDDDRQRRRSPPPLAKPAPAPAPPPAVTRGDGGWGKQQQVIPGGSPGRPSKALPSQSALAGTGEKGVEKSEVKIVEPNYAPSGALAAETNTFQGVVLKYNEPPEARKPVRNWRLYVFKGKEQLDLFHVQRQSAYLIGRDRVVADIPIEHPSTSKQHAVLQYRQVFEKNEFGDTKTLTKPFLIDLDSANGTIVNDEMIPPSRYYELKSNDVIKFAFSTREYVLLAE